MSGKTIGEFRQSKRRNAKSRGIEFDLNTCQIEKLLSAERCYYTGTKFTNGKHKLSLERVDPRIGYVDGNVVAVSRYFNTIRGSQKNSRETFMEAKRFLARMDQHIECVRLLKIKNHNSTVKYIHYIENSHGIPSVEVVKTTNRYNSGVKKRNENILCLEEAAIRCANRASDLIKLGVCTFKLGL